VGQINFNTINPKLQNLYAIHPLGMVESGNCCLAFSSNGKLCCAVKCFHSSASRTEGIEGECGNWNTVYKKLKGFLCAESSKPVTAAVS
jgi:hypothetical protein